MQREFVGARVLLVGDWPPPIGGVSVHVRSLREALRRAGADVEVLDLGRGQHRTEGVTPSGGPVSFGVGLTRLALRSGIVHLHTSGANAKSWALCAGVVAIARACGARALVTLHSGSLPHFLTTPARAIAARAALAGATAVVCVSDEIALNLKRIGAGEGRLMVAPAFGREGLVPGDLPALVHDFRANRRPFLAAMVAPGRHYGLHVLLEAFATLRTTRDRAGLVLFGPGSERASPGNPSILGLGAVERAVALSVLRAADVFVRPTLRDGDAVTVREALAFGTPVVATSVGTRPPGVVTCPPDDAASLEAAIRQVVDGPARELAPPAVDGIEAVLGFYRQILAPEARARPVRAG